MSDQQFPSINMYSLNQQEVQKTIENNKIQGGGDYKWTSTDKPGRYVFYVLPPFNQRGVCGLIVGKHYKIPNERGELVAHIDVETTFPERGWKDSFKPVIEKYKIAGLDVSDYETSSRSYIPVLVYETPEHPNGIPGIHILRHTPVTLTWIYEKLNDKYYPQPIFHPLYGAPISITKVIKGGNTSYDRQVLPNSPWREIQGLDQNSQINLINTTLKEIPDLDKLFNVEESYLATMQADAARLDDLLNRKIVQMSQGVVAGNPNQAPYPSAVAQGFYNPPQGTPQPAQPFQSMPQPTFPQSTPPPVAPPPPAPSFSQPQMPPAPNQPVVPPVTPPIPSAPGIPSFPNSSGAPSIPVPGTTSVPSIPNQVPPAPGPIHTQNQPPVGGAPVPNFPQFPLPNQ